jgi:Lon protease-like protein
MLSFNPFPLARMAIEQMAAYFAYYVEKRDVQVIVVALLFCLFGLPMAVLLDIARLPARIYERIMADNARQRLAEASPSRNARSRPDDANN